MFLVVSASGLAALAGASGLRALRPPSEAGGASGIVSRFVSPDSSAIAAARTIQKAFQEARYNPGYWMCRRIGKAAFRDDFDVASSSDEEDT